MEYRRGVRYPVELECRVSAWSRPTAPLPGKTLNMSRCGVLVSIHQPIASSGMPGVGELARVVVELPNAPYFRSCWLDCMCLVVRVEDQADSRLVAFDVKRYYFKPTDQSGKASTQGSRSPAQGSPSPGSPDEGPPAVAARRLKTSRI
jgi:hypothetical protein